MQTSFEIGNENENTVLNNEKLVDKLLQTLEQKKQYESVNSLLEIIATEKEKANEKIFIISSAYDEINKKYNNISLVVLILSSIATLLEALRLSIVDYVENFHVSTEMISFIINISLLFIGTITTISSSIIRFRNYQKILEQLKDSQTILISYRDKYNKKYQKVLKLLALDVLEEDEVHEISEKIQEYDDAIKSINVLQYIRNDQIIKFNKYKAYYDFEMRKIDIEKQMAIRKFEDESGINNINVVPSSPYEKMQKIHKFAKIQRLKRFLKTGSGKSLKQKEYIFPTDIVIDNLQTV